jgi:alkylation response protein AidB-like acyl-CoA dehydrogenase
MDSVTLAGQSEIVETAARLARDALAPRAEHYDQMAEHPRESWQALAEHNLLAAAIPKAYGGLELDMLTYCQVIEKLAAGCTNTAMTVHMHSTVMRFIAALGTAQQHATFYPDVAEDGKLYGSWGSEPESRGGATRRHTTIRRTGDGYSINGVKHFCTMAGGAHRYMIHCSLEGAPPDAALLLALVPHGQPGLTITSEWNPLGMRGTVSPSVTLEECEVPAAAVLGEPGQAARQGVGLSFGLGYAAVYLGAAQAALDFTKTFCQTHHFDPEPEVMAGSLIIQRSVAEMAMTLEGARQVLYQSATLWPDGQPQKRALLAARAKYLATKAALTVTSQAIACVGGRSVHKYYPLERIFRDIRTCTLMPPNVDRSLEIIGKAELSMSDKLFADERVG